MRAVWFVAGVLASVVAEAVAVLYVKTQLDHRYDRRLATAFAPDHDRTSRAASYSETVRPIDEDEQS